jgi:ABC-2 type transport system permease protein
VSDNTGSRPIIFLVARREILLRLRSRVFTAGTVAMVALIVVGIGAATLLIGKTTPVRVGFDSATQALEQAFTASAAASGAEITVSDVADEGTGRAQVTAGTLDVLVTGSPTDPVAVVKMTVPALVATALNGAVVDARLIAAGLQPAAVASAVGGAHFEVEALQPANPQRTPQAISALVVGIALYVALGLYGTFVAQGVVEEKATRIIEILLATVPPSRLLAGKIIGIGLVGLLQLSIIAAIALVLVSVTNVVSIPTFTLAAILGYLMWFTLGFLLYATAYAAVASTVSRSEEVQGATAPIQVFLIVGYVAVYASIGNLSGPLATVLSLLPPFAPTLMSVRMAGSDVPAWQVGLAVGLILVSIGGLIWLAGRIYSNSVLRLGAPVRLRDALRGK